MKQRVHEFLGKAASEDPGEVAFDNLALEIFEFQYHRIPAYRRLCQARGLSIASVSRWQDIPTAPAELFKTELLETVPRGPVFYSSGTTEGTQTRSKHRLEDLDTYREASRLHFRRCVLPDGPGPMATLLLGPSAPTHPHSSLGRMYEWCATDRGNGNVGRFFSGDGTVDLEGAVTWLCERERETSPVLILAISSAITGLLETLRAKSIRLHLPAASRLVDTGGAKGGRVLSAKGILKGAWGFLHIPAYQCVNEYGMTEMLSQFYDDALLSRHEGLLSPRAKLGPGWVRTRVVDPATLENVPAGQKGLLAHYDLANWASLSALQTLDVGRITGRGFEVTGRAAKAESRGCSQLMQSAALPAGTGNETA